MTKRRSIAAILSAMALVGLAVAWHALGKTPEPKAGTQGRGGRVPLVAVQTARLGEIARSLELTGEVVATDAVVIAATKEGPITYCPWREGDDVRAGEQLVGIDRETHRAEALTAKAALAVAEARLADLRAGARAEEIARAKANVSRWRATLSEARKAYQRQAELVERDFTSQQDVDRARESMEVAEAELAAAEPTLRMLEAGPTPTEIAVQEATVKEAQARLALADAHLAECVVAAPFDGRITRVHCRPGDLAVPRIPLVEMYALDSLVVRFSVPETFAAAVRTELKVGIALDAFPGRTFSGTVNRVYPDLDPVMRTRTVEAGFDDAPDLMPNQFARVLLRLEPVKAAVIVPGEAVLETARGGSVVYVVEDGKALRRAVELGVEGDEGVQIAKGVDPGEAVVVAGNEELRPGATVRIAGAGQGKGSPSGRGDQSEAPRDAGAEKEER